MIDKTLVLYQPCCPTRSHLNRTRAVWNGIGRIRDITVKGIWTLGRRGCERQLMVWLKIQSLIGDIIFRRPRSMFDPLICARSKRQSLWTFTTAFSFQVVSKERCQDILAVVS